MMRVFAGILLLITALFDLFAGLGYLLTGFGFGGMLGMLSGMAGQMPPSGAELQQLGDMEQVGSLITGGLGVFGVLLVIGAFVIFAGAIFLFGGRRRNFVIVACIMALLFEVAGIGITGFGIGNIIGLLGGVLGLVAARGIPASESSTTPGKRPYNTLEKALVAVILVGLLGIAALGTFRLVGSVTESSSALVRETMPEVRITTSSAGPTATGDGDVEGELQGQPFKLSKARISGDILHIDQGEGFLPDLGLIISLFNDGNLPEGKTYQITPDTGFGSPHIHLKWNKPDGGRGSDALTSGYDMELQFEQVAGGVLPGRINVVLPAEYGTRLSGRFEASVQK